MKKYLITILLLAVFGLEKNYAQCPAGVDFTMSATRCTNQGIDFTNTSATGKGALYSYSWNFDFSNLGGVNPSNSILENPTGVLYTKPSSQVGNYTVQLTVTEIASGCTKSRTHNLTVNTTPSASFSSTAPDCTTKNVDFTNTGSSGGGFTYSWNFGSGSSPSSSASQNPTNIVYSSAGSKTVKFIITSNSGCGKDSVTNNISIYELAKATFTSSTGSCTGQPINFYNAGNTGDPGFTHNWTFPADASVANSTAESPSGISFSSSGVKYVTHSITTGPIGCATTQSTSFVTVNPAPSATFTLPDSVCGDAVVNIVNSSSVGVGTTYSWDFGKDAVPASSIAQNPTGLTYSSPGTKTVTLNVRNNYGCTSTDTQIVKVNAAPVASLASTAPACTGRTVDFKNAGTTGLSYAWDLGSGAVPAVSVLENPTGISYATAGTKTIALTVTNTATNCSANTSATININQTPAVGFSSNAPVCAGEKVKLSNTGSTGAKWLYSWDFGKDASPATSSAETNTETSYESGGMKVITLTITDGNCTNTFSDSIKINALPKADAGKDSIICANTNIRIGSASNAAYSYLWYPANTLSSATVSNPLATPKASTNPYHLIVTDTLTKCQNTDSVIVYMLSPISAYAGPDREICFGDSVQIGLPLTEGQTYSWSPSAGVANAASPNPMSSPAATTTYVLTVSAGGCTPVKDEVTVTVHPLPDADAGKNTTITRGESLTLNATGGVMYAWVPAASLSNVGIADPVVKPDSTHSYKVKVTDVHGCVNNDSILITVIEPDVWLPNSFTPNGDNKNDVFYLRGQGVSSFVMKIFDNWGTLVFETESLDKGWDGNKMGSNEELPGGGYLYVVSGLSSTGQAIDRKGVVNLIR